MKQVRYIEYLVKSEHCNRLIGHMEHLNEKIWSHGSETAYHGFYLTLFTGTLSPNGAFAPNHNSMRIPLIEGVRYSKKRFELACEMTDEILQDYSTMIDGKHPIRDEIGIVAR